MNRGVLVKLSDTFPKLLAALSIRSFSNRPSGFVVVTNDDEQVVGVVTDADVRKFFASHTESPSTVSEIVNRDFVWVYGKQKEEVNPIDIARRISERGWRTEHPVRFVPVLDEGFRLVHLVDTYDFQHEFRRMRDQIVVVGLGYVGLTLLLAIGQSGRHVIGIDNNQELLDKLRIGQSPIYEEGIDEALQACIAKNTYFSSDITEITVRSGVSRTFIICLPTPLNNFADKKLDISSLMEFARDLANQLQQGDTIVMRSTVPVGTGRNIVNEIEGIRNWIVGHDFYFVQAPERTVEGKALREILDLPQVIGGATAACLERGLDLFQDLSRVLLPVSSIEVAEIVKIAGNAFRDYTFAFANYLSLFASQYNVDVNEVIEKSNYGYPRSTIPLPSPGVGGPCLTKDPYLLHIEDHVFSPIQVARQFNETIPQEICKLLERYIEVESCGLCIGMAFKGEPPTKDIRNSTGIEIYSLIAKKFRELHQWDAVIDHRDLSKGISSEQLLAVKNLNFFAILNNHVVNSILAKSVIIRQQTSKMVLFDPWRLLDDKALFDNSQFCQMTYISMSHVKVYERNVSN